MLNQAHQFPWAKPAALALGSFLTFLIGCSPATPRATGPVVHLAATTLPSDTATTAQPASAVTSDRAGFSASGQFDAALVRLTQGEKPEPLATLPPEERDLISSVLGAIDAFRHALAEQGTLMSAKTAPLVALSDQLRSQAPLSITTLALCRSVTQFGVYDPVDPVRFTAGVETPVIIYCELDNFRSRTTTEPRFETKLSYEAVLYTDADNAVSVISKKPTNIVDLCRNQRRDFFLADRLTLPGNLPVGKYLLKVTVVDQIANRVAEKTVPVMISPG